MVLGALVWVCFGSVVLVWVDLGFFVGFVLVCF